MSTVDRVYADLYRAMYAFERIGPAQGHAHLRTALERARDLGDDRVLTDAMGLAMAFLRAPRDLELVQQLDRELSSQSHTGLRTYPLAARLLSAARIDLGRGDREAAEQAWRELLDITEQRRDTRMEVWALTAPISIAVLDGRLEEAIELVETQRRLAEETGILGVQFGVGFPLTKVPNARAHYALGRDVEPLLSEFEGLRGPWRAVRWCFRTCGAATKPCR